MFRRFQTGLVSAKPAPGGATTYSAQLARTGIVEYRRPDGSIRREYRPKAEVFHPKALASFANAPVTDGHPPRHEAGSKVTPENWRRLSIGHLSTPSDTAFVNDGAEWVTAPVTVQHGPALLKIGTDLVSCSMGYQCKLDETPGVTPEGERYDAVQRDIRGNHLALLRKGNERQKGAQLKLDSNDDEQLVELARIKSARKKDTNMRVVKLDGAEHEVPEAIGVELATQAAKLDAAEKDLTAVKSKLAKAEGDLASTTARADSADKTLGQIHRAEVLATLEQHLPEDYKNDGKTIQQMRCDALDNLGIVVPEAYKDSVDYVAARLDGVKAINRVPTNVVLSDRDPATGNVQTSRSFVMAALEAREKENS